MPIDLSYSPQVLALVEQTEAFTMNVVLPVEDEHNGDVEMAGGDDVRCALQKAAKAAGVFAPHAPIEYGGHGLNMSDRAPVFEAAGYSLFGPIALNVAAPDEGNVHLLAHVANPEQRQQFLEPLAQGEVRSAFAMTEPASGAGSDPLTLTTRAERADGGWRITGHKWFITGADGASFFIIFARTSGDPGQRGGATMFLSPADAAGLQVGRHIDTPDKAMLGGYCEVFFEDLFVSDAAVLGEVDRGYDVAVAPVAARKAFGARIGDLGMVQKMLADNEIDIASTRALLTRACWELDRGGRASTATPIAKTHAPEAIFRVVDRSTQMCGGLGVCEDLPLARLAREVRPFRIYDGPSEVRRRAIAKRVIGAAKHVAQEQK